MNGIGPSGSVSATAANKELNQGIPYSEILFDRVVGFDRKLPGNS